MFSDQISVAVVTMGACVFAGMAILWRVSREKCRLVERYSHLKVVMRKRDQLADEARRDEQERRQTLEEEMSKRAPQADLVKGELPESEETIAQQAPASLPTDEDALVE